ncbi:MAG: ATP-binding cassette domain-containing protein [Bacteriovoracaceae bacterium]|nr:ATP-binding cassette domain-containing protein [Bacteriovoracaceae bacterium]
MSVVEFKNVHFSYSNSDTELFRDVNFSVDENEFVSVIGPNATGKSTLLKLMLGLLKPTSGTVTLFGKKPEKTRAMVGYMPQNFNFDPLYPMSILDVTLMGRLTKDHMGHFELSDYKVVFETLAEMDLLDEKDRQFSDLSGGQRQRVLLARTLASKPEFLIFDEPTNNVDVLIEGRIFEILKNLNNKMAIVIVSHDLNFVHDMVGKVVCLHDRTAHIHSTEKITSDFLKELHERHYRLIRHDH